MHQAIKHLLNFYFAQTVFFITRVGDVQFLKIQIYLIENSILDLESLRESLKTAEKNNIFKGVVTGGTSSKPISNLFSKQIQNI